MSVRVERNSLWTLWPSLSPFRVCWPIFSYRHLLSRLCFSPSLLSMHLTADMTCLISYFSFLINDAILRGLIDVTWDNLPPPLLSILLPQVDKWSIARRGISGSLPAFAFFCILINCPIYSIVPCVCALIHTHAQNQLCLAVTDVHRWLTPSAYLVLASDSFIAPPSRCSLFCHVIGRLYFFMGAGCTQLFRRMLGFFCIFI